MEAQVIPLPVKKKEKKVVDLGPEYFCLRCDGGDFKLFAGGGVVCSGCGSAMRNLLIVGSPESA